MKLTNHSEEKIDVLIEGNQNPDKTLILVHGFGTDKNETANLFPEISNALSQKFRIVRFDFTGCGKSEGKDLDINFQKHAEDLDEVLRHVKRHFLGKIYIYAHSIGCFVTALLSPNDVDKIIFGAPPNTAKDILTHLQARITQKGGTVNEQGVTTYPRSTGKTQQIGPSFWQVLKTFDDHQAVAKLAAKTNLMILKPLQDDVVGNDNYEHYKNILELTYQEINGDHSFTKPEDRQILIQTLHQFLSSS